MNEKAPNAKPIARKHGLVIQALPDEVLVYDRDRDRAHCLNQTAAFVWQRCDGKSTTAQIARNLGHQFGCTVDEKIVWLALDQLGKNHLLDRQPALPPALMGMNRRSMVRAIGLAAIVAVPVITSIVAPTAMAATSGGVGAPCSTDAQCNSGLLCCSGQCQPSCFT
jgi:Coenzyme PQQ synthesis protein D (PqqD)/WAP-type (Whey Acidic Protein) 'four-disulfide core'